jgi:beta-N-acetylhexosaminidase
MKIEHIFLNHFTMHKISVLAGLKLFTLSCFQLTAQEVKPFSLANFYDDRNEALDAKVNKIFAQLNDTLIVGQMIVPAVGKHGKPTEHVIKLAQKGWIGGVLLLNGTMDTFAQFVKTFDSIAEKHGYLKPIYSADAEPTLIKNKIQGSTPVPRTNKIKTEEEVAKVANTICQDLKKIGITQNYAPVIDASPNQTVSNRSFGLSMDTVIPFSNIFIRETQKNNIVATAKHFPGHGFVVGDTHEKLVFIDGEMKEVTNYKPIIEAGVISIMVAHIAVKNNEKYSTNGLPSTCSRAIVTDLLKTEMGFKGIVVTDAMNMGGVIAVKNSGLKAAMAGCDMLLMPVKEQNDIFDILSQMRDDRAFRGQIYQSVKKIIRLKVCLGLID